MDADLDTLATALYVTTDDLLKSRPELAPWRPVVGMKPQVSDAEMVTLAVMAPMLGGGSEARWVRYALVLSFAHWGAFVLAIIGVGMVLRRGGPQRETSQDALPAA